MTRPLAERLQALLLARAGARASSWLSSALAASPGEHELILRVFATAPRVLGRGGLALGEADRTALARLAPDLVVDGWTVFDAGRALLLLELAIRWAPEAFAAAAEACYAQGDTREQESWLKALPLLPQPERFLTCAYDACRTNVMPVFEAIACENPFPARYFSDLHFNQLVLRSMFVGVALSRIVGREGRLNPTLTRMAQDFAAERRAAGRPVPADLDLALHA